MDTPTPEPIVCPVPDAVMRHYLEACERAMRACWAVADCNAMIPPGVPQPPNPRHAAVEAMQSLDLCLKTAFCGDGADAVVGYAMVTKSLAHKALQQRALGHLGANPIRAQFPGPTHQG